MKENLGSEFAGLQAYIMSEIDSPNGGGVLDHSDLKSFSNSD